MVKIYKDLDSLRALTVDDFIAHLRNRRPDGFAPEEVEIHYLMAAFDTFRMLESAEHDNPVKVDAWEPKSKQIQEIVKKLTAPENRSGLRAWYRRTKPASHKGTPKYVLNSFAEWFRQYLSRHAGEDF